MGFLVEARYSTEPIVEKKELYINLYFFTSLLHINTLRNVFITQAVRPGFSFRLSFFFPRSVTNRCLASRAHASLVQRTARIFYRSCRRVKS